jgi:DHA3 family tetracycline resistance protein-like MFS transporter
MSATDVSERKQPALAPLRHRNFALLWSGQAISIAGNGMFTIALPLEVLRITHSPVSLALVIAARTIPSIVLLLIGGTVVDRLSRRAVMLASDVTCGLALGALTILAAIHAERLPAFLVLAVILGAASAFFRPASTAIVPDIVPQELLVPANSLSSLSESLAQFLVGPLLGGVLIASSGATVAFGIDAGTFAASAACLAAMRRISEVKASRERLTRGVAEGIRYCRSQRWLWWSLLALGLANLACFAPSTVMEPLIVKDAFHAGPVALGIMVAASGSAGAIASVVTGRLPAPRQPITSLWTALIAAGLLAAAVGVAPWLWLAVTLSGLSWGLVFYANIIWMSTLQARTPAALLGRVSSIDWLFSLALTPLGTIAAGTAAVIIGVRPTVAIGGLLAAAAAGSILAIPGVTGSATAQPAGITADGEPIADLLPGSTRLSPFPARRCHDCP